MSRAPLLVLALLALAPLAPLAPAQGASYTNFESPQVRPVRLSADGSRLYAVNTPDNRLAVFSLANPSSPVLWKEIPVGLEPVTVAPRTSDEVWVVDHLGDSISIVSVSLGAVVDTIRVADEPADVVFAGSPARAFVSVSQSNEVRVYDPVTRALLQTIPIFGEDPRALAASADGTKVYVVVTESGNGTTILRVEDSPPPPPPSNPALPAAPQTALIVAQTDPAYAGLLPHTLPDFDVVVLDANTGAILENVSGVGTVNFGAAVRPGTGEIWVANTEARNLVRFEPVLNGHVVDSRVSRLVPGTPTGVTPFDLNLGIDYSVLPNLAALSTALAQPSDLVWDPTGTTLYVASFGTDRIGLVSAAGAVVDRIEIGTALGTVVDPRTKKGPRGLAHHPTQPRLYVLNRFSQTLQTIDTVSRTVIGERALAEANPEPWWVREGRGFLYDAKLSGNGTMSCSSCHVDANWDHVAWDLGNPGGNMETVPSPISLPPFTPPSFSMHPMKGPMTTQPLKGLSGIDPYHWRGDRIDLAAFNIAFPNLLGGTALPMIDLVDFVAFMNSVQFPPNPNRNVDNSFKPAIEGGSPAAGQTFFTTAFFSGTLPLRCVDCHALPTGTVRAIIPGSLLQESQPFKIPQLRGLHEKWGFKREPGPQRAGFGFLHDGQIDTIENLLNLPVFGTLSNASAASQTNRNNLQAFVLSFDTGTKPAVGYSRTVTAANAASPAVDADFNLLAAQVATGNCELIAKGTVAGEPRGWRYSGGTFLPDRIGAAPASWTDLKNLVLAGNATITIVGVPIGSSIRIGVDRDLDGVLDGDEGLFPYGASTPGCAGPIALRGNSEPSVANSLFALAATAAPASAPGILVVGLTSASVPVLGATLLVDLGGGSPLTIPLASDASGLAVLPLPIPNDPALAGGEVYLQAFFGSLCAPMGLAASDGLRVTVQP